MCIGHVWGVLPQMFFDELGYLELADHALIMLMANSPRIKTRAHGRHAFDCLNKCIIDFTSCLSHFF